MSMGGPIRVLHVFGKMNRGGAETMIMSLYRNIDRKRIQFDFIVHTNEECDYNGEIKKLGGKIYSIPKYTGKNHFQYVNAWNLFLKMNPEYRIIHGHVRSTASIYLNIANKYGLTTISHSHNTSSGKGVSAIAKSVLQYPIRSTANYFFACSLDAGEWLFGKDVLNSEKFHLLNNSIEANLFRFNEQTRMRIRKEFGITNEHLIGHVGRFHPQKNHDFIIEVFHAIKKKDKKAKLILVGEGELKKGVQQKVDKYDLNEDVIFTGVRSDIPDLLQAFDVFFMPSVHEGLPVTLMEAQASGLKCVVSDNITPDVKITNLVEFISLEKPVEYWANRIMPNLTNDKRNDTFMEICKAGYDVKENAQWLEEFYSNKHWEGK